MAKYKMSSKYRNVYILNIMLYSNNLCIIYTIKLSKKYFVI